MSSKPFWLINPDEQTVEFEFTSKTARDAALKAASRGYTDIYLADVNDGKIHIFRGGKELLSETKQNEYTRQRNITTKPTASKMAYRNLKQRIRRNDVSLVCEHIHNMKS